MKLNKIGAAFLLPLYVVGGISTACIVGSKITGKKESYEVPVSAEQAYCKDLAGCKTAWQIKNDASN